MQNMTLHDTWRERVPSACRLPAAGTSRLHREAPLSWRPAAGALAEESREAVGHLVEAHRILLDEILAQQLRDTGRGIPHGNSVARKEMTAPRQHQFRWALEQVDRVRGVLGMPVFG